jgi:hypothetical protein
MMLPCGHQKSVSPSDLPLWHLLDRLAKEKYEILRNWWLHKAADHPTSTGTITRLASEYSQAS